jgi:ATP-dependent exoDNAse (exonuclease V) alpha subunit
MIYFYEYLLKQLNLGFEENNMLQETALNILKSGRNVFLTGSAGTGKTFVLNQFITHLKDAKIEVAITASTGIAATHIKGSTIHSWSGLGVKQVISPKDLEYLKKTKVYREQFNKTKVLIIDEISMLHKDQLNSLHHILSYCRDNNEAFGGLQIVLCGDFFQLPPIGNYGELSRDKFAFMSDAWQFANFNICYLTKQYRQVQNALTNILEEIRKGEISKHSINLLEKAKTTQFKNGIEPTKLYTHNEDVDLINNQQLQLLPGKSRYFKARTSGDKSLVNTLKKSVLTQDDLALRIGAKVMFIKNNPDKDYINGTLGELIAYSDLGFPIVKTLDQHEIIASTEEWSITNEEGKALATYQQIPLRLAWAITVHKSQGMTLDAAELDLSRTFEKGQGYVALSRLRDIEKLRLLGFNRTSLQVDNLALKADKRFQELSKKLENQVDVEVLNTERKDFVKKVGGRNLKKL